jgi:hypothetical protein
MVDGHHGTIGCGIEVPTRELSALPWPVQGAYGCSLFCDARPLCVRQSIRHNRSPGAVATISVRFQSACRRTAFSRQACPDLQPLVSCRASNHPLICAARAAAPCCSGRLLTALVARERRAIVVVRPGESAVGSFYWLNLSVSAQATGVCGVMTRRPLWVTSGNPQSEHTESAFPPESRRVSGRRSMSAKGQGVNAGRGQ